MKIKFVSTYPPVKCGIAEYTKSLEESLGKLGTKTEIVKIDNPSSSNPFYFLNLAKKAAKNTSENDIIHIQFQISRFGKLLGVLPGFYLFLFLPVLRLKTNAKIIITLHDIPKMSDARELGKKLMLVAYYYRLVYFFISAFCDKIIVHSENGRRIAVDEWKFRKEKVIIIPLGLPNKAEMLDKNTCKKKLGFPGKKILLIFGYARGYKDYGMVLEALSKMEKNTVLLITGGLQLKSHEKVYNDLMKKTEELGLNDRVKVLGFVEEKKLPVLFGATDVSLLPYTVTFGDFSSASMADQLAYQVPIIAANIHPFESFKKENKCIETFNRKNADDLVKKIKLLLHDQSKIKYLKEQSKSYWQKNNWNETAKKTKNLYLNLIK